MAVVEESWRHGVEHTAVAWYSNRLLGGDGVRECVGAPKTFIAQPAAQITDERRSILRAQINSLPLLFPIPGFETQPRGRAENARRFVTAGAIFDSGSCMIDAYDVCVRCEGASSHRVYVCVGFPTLKAHEDTAGAMDSFSDSPEGPSGTCRYSYCRGGNTAVKEHHVFLCLA